MIRFGKLINLSDDFLIILAREVIEIYKEFYPVIETKKGDIFDVIIKEQEKFLKTLEKGLKFTTLELEKGNIDGSKVFFIYKTYGFPIEMIEELANEKGRKIINKEGFYEAKKKHQEVSRAGVENKFGGVGKDVDSQSEKLHTVTHLLHQALRMILGDHIQQKGSNINSERLRFDFNHPQKIEREDLKKIEDLVNKKIQEGLEVKKEEMKLEEALQSGALAFFKDKYPEFVSVYSVGGFSKEICAGPHVKNTKELGHFKILKEKSSSSGVRRIKAILE